MKKRYKVLEETGSLKEGDILVEHDSHSYLYCTDKICTTTWTIEENPDKFQLLDL